MVDTDKQQPTGCRTFTATVTVTFPYETAPDDPVAFERNLVDALRGNECGIPPFVNLAISGAAAQA